MIYSDTIPTCMTLAEALLCRKRRGMLEDYPATTPSFPMTSAPSPDAEPNISDLPKPKRRGSWAVNLDRHAAPRRPNNAVRDDGAESFRGPGWKWDVETPSFGIPNPTRSRPNHNGISSTSDFSSNPPPPINGHSSGISQSLTPPLTQNGSEHGAIPLQSQYPDSHSHSRSPSPPLHAHNDPAWTGQFTGPASGFLNGPVVPFGRANQNPGRTIYSQSTSQCPE